MTIDEHAFAVRRQPNGMKLLVERLRADPGFAVEVRARMAHYAAMEAANRLDACWVSRTTKSTLEAALATANTSAPDVPAGAHHV